MSASNSGPSVEEIRDRLGVVQTRIGVLGSGEVELVVVTKTFDAATVSRAIEAGADAIGENYAQEVVAKSDALGERTPPWHFLGQVQKNKINKLAPTVALWQSVDSVDLAEAIAKRAPGAAVLLQVNVAGEEQRGGCRWDELDALHASAANCGLAVRGLMAVASADPEAARAQFRRLRTERDARGLDALSMGMSGDFEVAVAEGSTMVRLGTAILGNR